MIHQMLRRCADMSLHGHERLHHSFRWLARGFFVCLFGCVVFVCFLFTSPKICFVFIFRRICFVFTSCRVRYISCRGWCQRFLPPVHPLPPTRLTPSSSSLFFFFFFKNPGAHGLLPKIMPLGIPLLRLELTISSDSFFPTASVHRDV